MAPHTLSQAGCFSYKNITCVMPAAMTGNSLFAVVEVESPEAPESNEVPRDHQVTCRREHRHAATIFKVLCQHPNIPVTYHSNLVGLTQAQCVHAAATSNSHTETVQESLTDTGLPLRHSPQEDSEE